MSRIKSVNHGFNEVNDECARIFVNLVIYMHAKNSDEMPLLMYFISKLHPMKTEVVSIYEIISVVFMVL